MPDDIWSYRWVILRGILTLPLTLFAALIGIYSKSIQDKIMRHVGNFVWWYY